MAELPHVMLAAKDEENEAAATSAARRSGMAERDVLDFLIGWFPSWSRADDLTFGREAVEFIIKCILGGVYIDVLGLFQSFSLRMSFVKDFCIKFIIIQAAFMPIMTS